ncbi:MAG: hypothetical protein KA715_10365 [Xanthomonadaceae bacterium]|nr:hypothetical protein [Xanthomonadaceae bacterium]
MILSWKALSVNSAQADVAPGIGLGYPGLLTLRAVAHPDSFANGALGFQAEFSGWNQTTIFRADVRAANSMKPLRTVWFAGIMSYGATVAATRVSAMFAEVGIIAELRFIPGIGISLEAAPQYALSGTDQLASPFSMTASAGLVFWMDWW